MEGLWNQRRPEAPLPTEPAPLPQATAPTPISIVWAYVGASLRW